MDALREKGIGSQVLYIPVPLQPYYRKNYGFAPGMFPAAENYYEKALAIPLFPRMTEADQNRVIDVVSGLSKA